jgi:hypothetical protein
MIKTPGIKCVSLLDGQRDGAKLKDGLAGKNNLRYSNLVQLNIEQLLNYPLILTEYNMLSYIYLYLKVIDIYQTNDFTPVCTISERSMRTR